MAPVKKGGAFPLTAGFSAEQRPRPRQIVGASVVLNVATELDDVERAFFLQAVTGRFLFRDASECIENYVRHTRRKKETHPERLLFNSRIRHFKQEQRDRHCDEMKRRAMCDPVFRRDVKRIALQGVQFLESLNRQPLLHANTLVYEQRKLAETRVQSRTGFYDLDSDVVGLITQSYVTVCLKDPDAKRGWASLQALKLVNKGFHAQTCLIADARIADASRALWHFYRSGTLPSSSPLGQRVADLPWISYKLFACSSNLLMNLKLVHRGQHLEYFAKRIATKLDQSIVLARAHARGARSPATCGGAEDEDRSTSSGASASTTTKMRPCSSFELCNPENALSSRVLELFNLAAGA